MKQVSVKGMSCAHCVAAVKGALEELGLTNVQVSLESGLATFDAAQIPPDKLTASLEDIGFEAGEMA